MPQRASYYEYLAMTDDQLAEVDPVEINLLVAKSIPSLSHLDIPLYQRHADTWAEGVRERLPHAERVFAESPADWNDDLNFLRLAVLCEHLDCGVGLAYNEEQRYVQSIRYTDASDLFLNGLMESGRGTCGNMALAHVAVAWRLGWPVSLACVRSHQIARYDDGRRAYNIEATDTGRGGFSSRSDAQYIEEYNLSPKGLACGSELRALKPREMLGLFVGHRARHMKDIGNEDEAERDYLLARHLFPSSRLLYFGATWVSVRQSRKRFEETEEGSPLDFSREIFKRFGPSIHDFAHGCGVLQANCAAPQ